MYIIRHGRTNSIYGLYKGSTHIVTFHTYTAARQIAGELAFWKDRTGVWPPNDSISYSGSFKDPFDEDLFIVEKDEEVMTQECAAHNWGMLKVEDINMQSIAGTIKKLQIDDEEGDKFMSSLWRNTLEEDFKLKKYDD